MYNKFTEQISTTYHSHLALQLIRPWLPLDLCCAGPRSITYIKAGALVSKRGPSCVKTVFSKKAVICKKKTCFKVKILVLTQLVQVATIWTCVYIPVSLPSMVTDISKACIQVIRMVTEPDGLSPLKTRSRAGHKQKV